jgi:hypothetical protein
MRRFAELIVLGAFLVLGMGHTAGARQQPVTSPHREAAIAFVNVNVIPMEDERLQTGQTVLVQGDRIAAIGARNAVLIPSNARVIEGDGKYLVPGLTDAHVHLEGDGTGGTTRSDFGDAPLYLAHGVTTVFNLRGLPVHLEWRRRIESGELVGPTIYTSGEFVNEPRVNTVDEVQREVTTQAREGYDLIKYHEIMYQPELRDNTTTGFSLASYLRMNEVAREVGIPLVGHAPVNLGLEVLLQARQPLAHLGMLSGIYFLPLAANRAWLFITAAAIFALLVLATMSGAAAIVRRWRSGLPRPSHSISRVRTLVALQLLASVFAVVTGALFFPSGPLFDSVTLRPAFTALIFLMAAATVVLAVSTAVIWRDPGASPVARIQAAIASSASLAFVCAALIFWLPVAWRSSDAGIRRLARRIHDAGIPVQTTLVVYEAVGGPGRLRLAKDPAINHLRADVRARWRRGAQAVPPGYRFPDFMKKLAGALHRAGVPLMAGTDAMGFPLVAPGSSLHRELELLTESGLTPYEAMRAATVVPASFLGKDKEFGTIATGKRADLLLIDGNPLEDLTPLRRPIGVMARGRWFTHDELQQMLTALAHEQ